MDLVTDHSTHDLEQVNYFRNLLAGSKPNPHLLSAPIGRPGHMSGFMVMQRSEVGNPVIFKPGGLLITSTDLQTLGERKGQGERGLIHGLYYYRLHSD